MEHDWTPSTLGHGETMCRRCYGTNRELAALGELDHCTAASPLRDNDQGPNDGKPRDH